MKTLNQLTEASKDDLPSIYCDMDEVLVALLDGAKQVLGKPMTEVEKTERWNTISSVKNFWENLKWMPNAKRLYDFMSKYDAHILSAFTKRDPNSRNGKMKWLQKNAKYSRSNIHLVQREQKQKFAKTNGKPNVLIDDYIKNIQEWESKGGIGIHHTNVSKTINELKRLGFK
jgi:5'(3')-deoxyribonucleotidase